MELYISQNAQAKEYIRDKLLVSFVQESDNNARNKVGDAIAEVARQLSDVGELVPGGCYNFLAVTASRRTQGFWG